MKTFEVTPEMMKLRNEQIWDEYHPECPDQRTKEIILNLIHRVTVAELKLAAKDQEAELEFV